MRKIHSILLILISLMAVACTPKPAPLDPLVRARVDGLNKNAFLQRYKNPQAAIRYGRQSLALISDSLPTYTDGQLRAWNSIAFNYFILGNNDSAYLYTDSVLCVNEKTENHEVEQLIARLLWARLEQRNCRIANSYQILYEIDKSGLLDEKGKSFLYHYGQMEYYITSLTLNYHYRNGALDNVDNLLEEIEGRRSNLRCDYSEDMALNYAMAHAFYRLSAREGGDTALLRKSLSYLDENSQLLSIPEAYCDYHQANVYQLLAFITADTAIHPDPPLDYLDSVSFGLEMFQISTEMFFHTPDPYQHLGAVVAAADYCMLVGDTTLAWDYYNLAIEDNSWNDGFAPKFESMFYRGLISSGYADNRKDQQRWFAREMELLEYIQLNEKADFELQNELNKAHDSIHHYLAFLCGIILLLIGTILLAVKLHKQGKALRNETIRLQQAKQKDVERIANVETCLSVLRHDITPFVAYLQNKNLPDELRDEVVEQLIRTFDNIKNWTNLSIPSGLQFRKSEVAVQEIFNKVEASIPNFRGEQLAIHYLPSGLTVTGDSQLLEILLRNLVKNAVQYTEQGSITISADLLPEDPHFVRFAIQDTGKGMTPEELENLFRTDKKIGTSSDKGYGSGFGLILSRYIVKLHDDNILRGCRIWAESQPGEGSTFYFLIPSATPQK